MSPWTERDTLEMGLERHDEALADKMSSLATGWVGTETQGNGVILNLVKGHAYVEYE